MGCRFNHRFTLIVAISGILVCLSGCLSYKYERRVEGIEVNDPADTFSLSKTNIGDVLLSLGAPDEVYSLDNTDLLVYQRSIIQESGLSLGVPVLDVAVGGSIRLSVTDALIRYDTLIFWFNPQGTLEDIVFEKTSSRPYLKTLFTK